MISGFSFLGGADIFCIGALGIEGGGPLGLGGTANYSLANALFAYIVSAAIM